jgi:hypothetical protein
MVRVSGSRVAGFGCPLRRQQRARGVGHRRSDEQAWESAAGASRARARCARARCCRHKQNCCPHSPLHWLSCAPHVYEACIAAAYLGAATFAGGGWRQEQNPAEYPRSPRLKSPQVRDTSGGARAGASAHIAQTRFMVEGAGCKRTATQHQGNSSHKRLVASRRRVSGVTRCAMRWRIGPIAFPDSARKSSWRVSVRVAGATGVPSSSSTT